MQFVFVEFWVTVDFTRCGVNHGHWHFVFGTEVKQLIVLFSSTDIFRKHPVFSEKESIMQVLRF